MCKEIREILDLYVSGDLTPREAKRVEEHLKECEECRREASFWRERLGDLGALAAEAQTDPLGPSLWEGIEKEILKVGRGTPPSFWRRVLKPAAMAAAAAILFAIGAYFLLAHKAEKPSPASQGELAEKKQLEFHDGGVLLPPGTTLLPRKDLAPGALPEEAEESIEF